MNQEHFSLCGEPTVHLDGKLHDDATILRYMDFEKMKLFLQNGLRLARADEFVKDDPFEGEYTELIYLASRCVFKIEEKGEKAYFSETLKKEVNRIRSCAFVSSWALGKSESVAMWRLYGGGKDAVAIKTTVGQTQNGLERVLKETSSETNSLAKRMKKQIVKVDYIDHLNHKDVQQLFKINDAQILRYKNVGYQYEEEVRIIFDASEQGRGGIAERVGDSCLIAINPEEIINQMLVSPFACDCFFKSVQTEMAKLKMSERVRWSDLKFVPGTEIIGHG